jgi:hypothetical protein
MNNYKELLNPTPSQIKYRNRKWAEALINNKRKARETMYYNGGRCCLAVAQDVAHELGLVNYRGSDENFPHKNVSRFFGWGEFMPSLQYKDYNGKIYYAPADALNDGRRNESMNIKIYDKGISHKQIAECVLNTFVHPKKQSFSFSI